MPKFEVVSDYQPAGDQPRAIQGVADAVGRGESDVVLLGVTGSGKTYTASKIVEAVQKPTLVMAPNKTLAAQLANEFREFFPRNAVEYFVSYYDYYQPEAYVPSSDTYIEKDSSVNEEVERLRHRATTALLSRKDVLIVASVSCIYGLGSPDEYEHHLLHQQVVLVLVGRPEAVDAGHAGDDQDVLAGQQRGRRAVAEALDLLVDGGVLLDVGVARGHVRLGLVVVVVADEVLDGVARDELAELVGQLCGKGLVWCHHQRRLLHRLDDLRRGVGLAGAGDAQQDHVALTAPHRVRDALDGARLVTRRLVVADDLELRHGPMLGRGCDSRPAPPLLTRRGRPRRSGRRPPPPPRTTRSHAGCRRGSARGADRCARRAGPPCVRAGRPSPRRASARRWPRRDRRRGADAAELGRWGRPCERPCPWPAGRRRPRPPAPNTWCRPARACRPWRRGWRTSRRRPHPASRSAAARGRRTPHPAPAAARPRRRPLRHPTARA